MDDDDENDDDLQDEIEERKERQHFSAILRAFDNYPKWALANVARVERDYAILTQAQQALLGTADKIAQMRRAVNANALVLEKIIGPHREHIGAPEDREDERNRTRVLVNRPDGNGTMFMPAERADFVPESDMEKLQSTLKQFVREWGAEGAAERAAAHNPALAALQLALPGGAARGDRVLLPGSGLGRMAWECANLGFTAQGSEFSYFMLLAGNFILNAGLADVGSVDVHPWVLQTTNVRCTADQVRACTVPDTPPWSLPATSNFSMVAGDFLEVYRDQRACWEAVLTLFFIDTAHNIAHYLAAIWTLLTPGGAWVNLGPLLWHFADMPTETSVDIDWEQLKLLIVECGFVLETESWHRCPYVRNIRSMYTMEYDCVCFIARKPRSAANTPPFGGHPPIPPPPPGGPPPPPPS